MSDLPRDPLLDELADGWQRWDPMPDDLPDRILVSLAMADLDADYELLTLTTRSDHLLGARASGDDRTLLEFTADGFQVLVRVVDAEGGRRIDGWVEPGGLAYVLLTQDRKRLTGHVASASRFLFERIPAGLSQLEFVVKSVNGTRRFRSPHVEI